MNLKESYIDHENYRTKYIEDLWNWVTQDFFSYGIEFDAIFKPEITVYGGYAEELNDSRIVFRCKNPIEDYDATKDGDVLEKFIGDCVTDYIKSNPYDVENKGIKIYQLLVGSDGAYEPLYIEIRFKEIWDMPPTANVDINALGKALGFTKGDWSSCEIWYGAEGKMFRHEYKEFMRMPSEWSYRYLGNGTSFPYWDRFRRIKGLKDIYSHSDLRLAAEYVPNPDIIIIWTYDYRDDECAFLVNRSDFERTIDTMKDYIAWDNV